MSIRDELKRLKREEARLAIKKRVITAKIKIAREKSASLIAIVKNSGYKTPRDLIKALQEISSAGVRRRVVRRKAKAPAKTRARTAPAGKRRKRTKITVALRDAIRNEVKGGTSKNQVAKSRGISYAVVTKAVTGAYSKLK